jgi:hypothetical protein
VRRNDKALFASAQSGKVIEGPDCLAGATEIQQQNMFAFNRAFDSWNQGYASLQRIFRVRMNVELSVMECDRQCAVPELG